MSSSGEFDPYPFPKHLVPDVRVGHYRIFGDDGTEEVIAADNAKDAVSKTKIQQIRKLEYLGFYNKVILSTAEVTEEEDSEGGGAT